VVTDQLDGRRVVGGRERPAADCAGEDDETSRQTERDAEVVVVQQRRVDRVEQQAACTCSQSVVSPRYDAIWKEVLSRRCSIKYLTVPNSSHLRHCACAISQSLVRRCLFNIYLFGYVTFT